MKSCQDAFMDHAPAPLLSAMTAWSEPARHALWACRGIFHETAERAEIGPLDESLKWGQPAWRPRAPRTGSTLRMGWMAGRPRQLLFFVDCKTDLAARMSDIYPDLGENDGRRQIALPLDASLPEQPIAHLAQMTFCYHLSRRGAGPVG